jgi:hypothetical protein
VAPGQRTLGFMLPYIPLHHLLLERIDRPIVPTSGDLSDEPQCIGNDEARLKLAGIADYGRFHDRDIVNRIDDSVTRVTGREARVLRRDRLTVLDETECVFHLAPKARTEETPRSPPPTQSAPVHNHMFRAADIVIITRSDLLPHVDFSIDRCLGNMRAVDQELRPFRHHRRGGRCMARLAESRGIRRRAGIGIADLRTFPARASNPIVIVPGFA